MSGAGAFQALAGYLFGGNEQGVKLAMTTPVISTSNAAGAREKMSFVMPSGFWAEGALQTAPTPKGDAGVTLEPIDAGGLGMGGAEAVAVAWFGGFAGKADVAARRQALLARVEADSAWEATVAKDTPPLLLQYNDPFTPPWKRRNELALPVRRANGDTHK
uniref:SOUL heme-binding protein n=1 Tax=Calcidiscus leptoporus TaxID=127549 RepID=A0A7S0IQ04_9EUKA